MHSISNFKKQSSASRPSQNIPPRRQHLAYPGNRRLPSSHAPLLLTVVTNLVTPTIPSATRATTATMDMDPMMLNGQEGGPTVKISAVRRAHLPSPAPG